MYYLRIFLIISFACCTSAKANDYKTIEIYSSIDNVSRKARLCIAPKTSAPLLVYLPEWSGGHSYYDDVADLSSDRGWHLLAPKPRGATEGEIGSNLAIQDVLDAIAQAPNLLGGSPRKILGSPFLTVITK